MLRGEAELGEPWAKQLALGLGLVFLGKQGAVEATLEVSSGMVRTLHLLLYHDSHTVLKYVLCPFWHKVKGGMAANSCCPTTDCHIMICRTVLAVSVLLLSAATRLGKRAAGCS